MYNIYVDFSILFRIEYQLLNLTFIYNYLLYDIYTLKKLFY